MGRVVPLEGEYPYPIHRRLPSALRHPLLVLELAEADADHRLAQVLGELGELLGVLVIGDGSDDGGRAACGSPDLKMPEPDEDRFRASSIMRAASAGVATPPAEKLGTGRAPSLATSRTSS